MMVQRLIHLATALSPLAAATGVKGRFQQTDEAQRL